MELQAIERFEERSKELKPRDRFCFLVCFLSFRLGDLKLFLRRRFSVIKSEVLRESNSLHSSKEFVLNWSRAVRECNNSFPLSGLTSISLGKASKRFPKFQLTLDQVTSPFLARGLHLIIAMNCSKKRTAEIKWPAINYWNKWFKCNQLAQITSSEELEKGLEESSSNPHPP